MARVVVIGSAVSAPGWPRTRSSGLATIAARLALLAHPKLDVALPSNSDDPLRVKSGQPGTVAGVDDVGAERAQHAEHAHVVQQVVPGALVQVDDLDAVRAHVVLMVATIVQTDDGVAIALGWKVADQVQQTVFGLRRIERVNDVHDEARPFVRFGQRSLRGMLGTHACHARRRS